MRKSEEKTDSGARVYAHDACFCASPSAQIGENDARAAPR